jgi:hypothetical protein
LPIADYKRAALKCLNQQKKHQTFTQGLLLPYL